MGDQLIRMYQEAQALGGVRAKMKLASITRITSTQARAQPDTPERIEQFRHALAEIRRELGKGEEEAPGLKSSAPGEAAERTVTRLRQHVQVFGELVAQRALFLGDVTTTVQRITEAAANTLGAHRASVWFYDDRRTLIRCLDLFVVNGAQHSSGLELMAKDFPGYFKALEGERTIAAVDAHTDPRTSEFSASYLTPLGINAMLDVPIWVDGKMIGVVCHEHMGAPRAWTGDEESFAFLMANFVALAVENQRRAGAAITAM